MATLTEPKAEHKRLVHYLVEGGVAILELDDPPANTYTHEMMRQLDEAILRARFDDAVHVIVLRGHVGKCGAIEMMVKGETFSFERAKELGLVNEVFPADDYWEQAMLYAKQFCPPHKASKAVGLIKRAVQSGAEVPFESGLTLERELQQQLFQSDDAKEGIAAYVETKNNGKPLVESKIDVAMAMETLRYYAGWADKVTGDTLPVSGNFFTYTLREPVGVVGAIVPWNFPLNLATWKVAPALAAGCTVVLKPAHETPLTALLLGELAIEAGLPAGALNVVPGLGSVAGAALVRHPLVDKIAFTGSTEVGQEIMREAAGTLKRVTLELGGKSPNIIFADADLAAAVRGAQSGIFYGKGEVCAAGSRLLVEQSVHDQVVSELAQRAKKLVPGDPFDKNTRLGALVS